jgi:Xaa-Pro dipeptidase
VKDLNEQFTRRLDKLQRVMYAQNLDGIVLVPGPNSRFYTGVNSLLMERPFLLFIPKDKPLHLVAPRFESGPYERGPLKIETHSWTDSEGPIHALQTAISRIGLRGKWGMEGRVPFRFIELLAKSAKTEFTNVEPYLQEIREIKDEEEIRCLKRSASILSKSFIEIPSLIKSGMKESDVAGKLAQTIRANGADGVEDILVQSGESSADPHHIASSRKIRRKESIVIDTECTHSGYYADITRTIMIGNDHKFEDMYEKVLEAQTTAIKESRAGIATGAVDHAARETLRRYGLDKFFIHRTGHGLGLEVHEAPYLVENGTHILQPGMTFTIEPGIYIPSRMGIRIEDNLLTTELGNSVLSRRLPKNYGWWK